MRVKLIIRKRGNWYQARLYRLEPRFVVKPPYAPEYKEWGGLVGEGRVWTSQTYNNENDARQAARYKAKNDGYTYILEV